MIGAHRPARVHDSEAQFDIGCAIHAVRSPPAGAPLVMNGRIRDPVKVRKNVAMNRLQAAGGRMAHVPQRRQGPLMGALSSREAGGVEHAVSYQQLHSGSVPVSCERAAELFQCGARLSSLEAALTSTVVADVALPGERRTPFNIDAP